MRNETTLDQPTLVDKTVQVDFLTPPPSVPAIAVAMADEQPRPKESEIEISATATAQKELTDNVRATLRQMARLRRKILDQRTVAKEEAREIFYANEQVVGEFQKLMSSLIELKPRLEADKAQEITEWEDCLINIADYMDESKKAGQKFEHAQEKLIDLEWQLDVKEKHMPHEEASAESRTSSETSMDAAWPDFEYDEIAIIDADESDAEISLPPADAIGVDALQGRSSFDDVEPPGSSNMLPFSDATTVGAEDDPPKLSLADDDEFVKVYGPLGVNDHEFSQFMNTNVATLVEQARNVTHNLQPSFDENDLDRVFRWLAYGRPWSDLLGSKHEAVSRETPLPASMVTLLRTYVLHMLQLLSLNLQGGANKEEQGLTNFARLRQFWAKDWLWDPWSRQSALAHPPTNVPRTPLQQTQEGPAFRDDEDALQLIEPPSDVPTTHEETAVPHRGRTIGQTALSERSEGYVGRLDWTGGLPRSRAGSSPPRT